MDRLDPASEFNLKRASVLLVDRSVQQLDILEQILKGFGARRVRRCADLDEATETVRSTPLHLMLVDACPPDGDGVKFIRWLREEGGETNASCPVLMMSAQATLTAVSKARDAGANLVLAKPVEPSAMLQRILRVAQDTRPFIQCPTYRGPDRRVRREGPPAGMPGRRSGDVNTRLTASDGPNMSQNEIDSLLIPQRAVG